MKITHHPDASTLMSYAAGSLPEPLSAVVTVHLAMCASCRADHEAMDELGAMLIDALQADGPPAGLISELPARVSEVAAVAGEEAAAGSALEAVIGGTLSDVKWRRIGIGVWHCPLPLSQGASGDLRLLKVAPNQAMPEHGHGGSELTLLLDGAYDDVLGRFTVGDVADLDDTVEHRPISDRESGCVCLIASEKPAKFRGVIARMLQPITGI